MDRLKIPKRQRETTVQRAVMEVYQERGWSIYVCSQRRATQQTPGIPDLLIFSADGIFFHETKASGGVQRFAQKMFAQRCAAVQVDYVLGGVKEARRYAASIS